MRADSAYDGPETISELHFGSRSVRLVRPADPDRLLVDPGVLDWNVRDDYMPYWAYLWPGAFLLAEAVSAEPWGEGIDALEIGCGLGLVGLVGLKAGIARVQFTDYDEAPLRFVARSAAVNGFGPDRFSTALLDWREPPEQRFPVILGADVLYERRLVPLVVGVLSKMLAPEGLALVAGPDRVATEDLEPQLSAVGLKSEARPLTTRTEAGDPLNGTLHRIWRDDRRR
ncbi:hypothetical protein BH23PLA1_BH23PLA1_39500 [soil metagenome]